MNIDKLIKKCSQKTVLAHTFQHFMLRYDTSGIAMAKDIRCIDQLFRNEAKIHFKPQKTAGLPGGNWGQHQMHYITQANRLKHGYIKQSRIFQKNMEEAAIDALIALFYDHADLFIRNNEALSNNLTLIATTLKTTLSFSLNAACKSHTNQYKNLEFLSVIKDLYPICKKRHIQQLLKCLYPDEYFRISINEVSSDQASLDKAVTRLHLDIQNKVILNIIPVSPLDSEIAQFLIAQLKELPPWPECPNSNLVFHTGEVTATDDMICIEYIATNLAYPQGPTLHLCCIYLFPVNKQTQDQASMAQLLLALLIRNPEPSLDIHQQIASFAIAIQQPEVFSEYYGHLSSHEQTVRQILTATSLLPAHAYLLNHICAL